VSAHPNRSTYFPRLVRAFWQGATQPCVGSALGALSLVLTGAVFLAASSTEVRVQATDPSYWLKKDDDDYGRVTAYAIQGAPRHARGSNPAVVFVGSSLVQALLPHGAGLDEALSAGIGRPVCGLNLNGPALSYIEAAAVVDRFGSDFDGWLVVAVNRHVLARDIQDGQERKRSAGWLIRFESAVLEEEHNRARLPLPRRSGIPLLDHSDFYLRTLGGWRFAGRTPPHYAPITHRQSRVTIDPGRTLADLPPYDSASFETNFAVLSRMAERQRAAGGARLVLVECPVVDEVIPSLHTREWKEARERYIRRREAWSAEHQVPWLDVTDELGLRQSDYYDPRHVTTPEVRRRFAELVGQRLAALRP
jgi:hypothetical protein